MWAAQNWGEKNREKTWKINEEHGKTVKSGDFSRIFNEFCWRILGLTLVWLRESEDSRRKNMDLFHKNMIVSLFLRGVSEKRNILTNVSYWSSVHTPKKGWANDDGCVQESKNRDYQPFSTNQKGAGVEELLDFQHINWSHFFEMSG